MSFIQEYNKIASTDAKSTPAMNIESNDKKLENLNTENSLEAKASSITRVELVELTEKERPGGEQPIVTLTSAFNKAKEDTGRYSEFALQIVRKLNKDGDKIGTELVVRSPIIRGALQAILESYAYLNLMADPIIIEKPYHALFHYRKELSEYADSSDRTTEEAEHMKLLTEKFFRLYILPIEKMYIEEIPKGRVRFDLLWTLFRAEDDILVQTDYFREIHRVVHCEEKKDNNDDIFFYIYTWRWGYHAEKFGPNSETIRIPKFSSTRRIEQLHCFPLKVLEAQEQKRIYHECKERGYKWRNLLKPVHQFYEGPMWVDPPGDRAKNVHALVIQFTKGRIMLDYKLHVESNAQLADQVIGSHGFTLGSQEQDSLDSLFGSLFTSSNGLGFTSRAGSGKKVILNRVKCYHDNDEYTMTDEEAWLSPARVRGYSLSEKRWALFMVQSIDTIDFKENSFHALQMEVNIKETIRALVEMHNRSARKFDDLVKGKGKGIIISLEGPPGAGKTLTAESIAELTHKPLYSISAAELSTRAEYAEYTLRMIFARATRWNAVVLLDEADLFLAKRTTDDLERNAFVTMFLRLLEYYQGIMFLTSNRVEEFDTAFNSRIHLKVPYQSPSAATRAAIWANFLRKNDDCRNWEEATFERLGRDLEINGREIKNLVGTSLAIAAYRKKPLSEDILRFVHSVNMQSVNSKA